MSWNRLHVSAFSIQANYQLVVRSSLRLVLNSYEFSVSIWRYLRDLYYNKPNDLLLYNWELSIRRPTLCVDLQSVLYIYIYIYTEWASYQIPLHSSPSQGPPNLLSNGYRRPFSQCVKEPGCGADHSLPSSVEAKNRRAIPPFLHMSSWLGS
jgi:hypothetical protein